MIGARPERVSAPAKLTVSLAVTGRRPDGYHELEAEMVAIDLADELLFVDGGSGLEIEADPSARAEGLERGPGNLVTRALELLGRPATVVLRKRIPVQGGLGGGSTDAAAVLRWAGCEDLDLAATLGGDVPFCVVGGRAMVRGIGEQVSSLEYEARSFVLLVPPFGVDTAAVYRAHDELGKRRSGQMSNQLTAAALVVEPRLAAWRDMLGAATGAVPHLAGSGSTWFAEGTLESLGLTGRDELEWGAERARLYEVATVPSGWELPTVP